MAPNQNPTVVLVHGAFAESASWNGVIERLQDRSIDALAVANPLRSLGGDAAYVRDVIASLSGPVVLVGHSYGGMVITEAASENPSVVALVYVCAFAPDSGESALELSANYPGSTLGDALDAYPVSIGGIELAIRGESFHQQFAADLHVDEAAVMAATQRPATEAALTEPLLTEKPAWTTLPSWFVFSEEDRNIPVALHRYLAGRANARGIIEVTRASHALSVSNPEIVTRSILDAIEGTRLAAAVVWRSGSKRRLLAANTLTDENPMTSTRVEGGVRLGGVYALHPGLELDTPDRVRDDRGTGS